MLTVDFDRFPVGPGIAFLTWVWRWSPRISPLYRRGANVVALDMDADELRDVSIMFEAMAAEAKPQQVRPLPPCMVTPTRCRSTTNRLTASLLPR